MDDHNKAALIAIGDQVQTVIENSEYQIITAILVAVDGGIEVRSLANEEDTRAIIKQVAEDF